MNTCLNNLKHCHAPDSKVTIKAILHIPGKLDTTMMEIKRKDYYLAGGFIFLLLLPSWTVIHGYGSSVSALMVL